MKQKLSILDRIWYENSWLKWLLWPLSVGYACVMKGRAACYRRQWFHATQMPVPVIVVGNLTVGGTGKTPFCIALSQYLKTQGYRPGLVSRGYGGRAINTPQIVTVDSDPDDVGDEPVLLVKKTGCPMVVGKNRVAAAHRLLNEYDCDVIVSDDGLQHYALKRNFEIVIVDAIRGLGNGLCLPAGPLREPASRIHSVDRVVSNHSSDMMIHVGVPYSLLDTQQTITPEMIEMQQMIAIAGIANPQRFFTALSDRGFIFTTQIFPDHHIFSESDLKSFDANIVMMTEKDAVKFDKFADARCYALPIEVKLSEKLLNSIIDRCLKQ